MITAFFSKNKFTKLLLPIVTAVLFVFTERTIRNAYWFGFSWRAKTVYSIGFIVCSWFCIVLFAIYLLKKPKLRRETDESTVILAVYFAMYMVYLATTLHHGGSVSRWWDALLYSMPPMFLSAVAFNSKKDAELYIGVAAWIFLILNAANLVYVLFPRLWDLTPEFVQEYFLGFHTLVGFTLILGLLFVLLYNVKWMAICYLVMFFANVFLIRQGVIFVAGMMVLIWLVPPVKKFVSKVNFWWILGFVLLAFICLVFFLEPITTFGPIKNFLWDVLHKEPTLSGRMYLWDDAVNKFLMKPGFGYGIQESFNIVRDDSNWWNLHPVHAHNLFLHTLLEGGLAVMSAGFTMLAFTVNKINRNKNSLPENINAAFRIVLFTLLIMYQADLDAYYPWYLMAFVCQLYFLSTEVFNEQ